VEVGFETGTVSSRVKARRRRRKVMIDMEEIYCEIVRNWTGLGSLTEFGYLAVFAKIAFGRHQDFREELGDIE
jgi:hypothetical protein